MPRVNSTPTSMSRAKNKSSLALQKKDESNKEDEEEEIPCFQDKEC
jgi:hypothetical protein